MKVVCLLVLLAIAVNGSTIRKIREASAKAPAIETGKDLLPESASDDLETAETFYKKIYVPVPYPVYIKHHGFGGFGGGYGGGYGGGFGGGLGGGGLGGGGLGGGAEGLLNLKLSLLSSLAN